MATVGNAVILIPTFNSAEFLPATLDSLERQHAPGSTLPPVIIADDASTDATLNLVRRRRGGALDITIDGASHNVGQWSNVNRALRALGGRFEWVLILHSDDLAKPDWLRVMLERLTNCRDTVASVCSSWDNLKPDGTVEPGEDAPDRGPVTIAGGFESVTGTLRRGCWWHISGCAIRMSAFTRVGEFDVSKPQMGDFDWLLRCLADGWDVEYVPRTLIGYRHHEQSVSTGSFAASRDITESLTIVRRFAPALSIREIVSYHLARTVIVLRRLARSILARQPRRMTHLAGVLVQVGGNLWMTLSRHRRGMTVSETDPSPSDGGSVVTP